jgi:hypothetical protein
MTIYLIEHPSEKITDVVGGIDFYQGRGTTSNKEDALRLGRLGYLVTDQETGSAVVPSPEPVVAPRTFANKKDRESHEARRQRYGFGKQ